MEHPYLTYFVDLLAPAQDRHFVLIGTALGCISALHVLRLADLILPRAVREWYYALPARVWHLAPALVTARILHSTAWRSTGINDSSRQRRYELVAIVLELTQIATQVYQAHRSSHLISRVWINRCYVAIVVLFCWTTPLLHTILRRHSSAERAACLAVDALLNIAYSIVLPLVIFVPYMRDYDPEVYSFSLPLLYGDESFGSLVLENQSIFAVSLFDCGSKLVPHVSALASLTVIGQLLRRQAAMRERRVAPDSATGVHTYEQQQQQRTRETKTEVPVATRSGAYSLVRSAIACFGAGILAIHVTTEYRLHGSSVLGCKQTMRPWFAAKYSCSVFEFNCDRRGLTSPLVDSLDFLDEQTLTSLVISHCSALEVPASIQRFQNLLGVELYNSTLVRWDARAGISATLHRKMVFLILCRVNMTALPVGVLGPLPDMLQDIEISHTNLTALPEDLHEHWHSLSVLYFEWSAITTFPRTLLELEVYDLSLIGNRIETIDALPVRQSNYYVLALSHNPLRELPRALPSSLAIGFLGLERTNVTYLPDWIDPSVAERVWLSGTPVCEPEASSSDGSGSSDANAAALVSSGKCVCNEVDPRGWGRYPLALTEANRLA